LPDGKICVIHNPVFDPDIEALSRAAPDHPFFEAGGPPIIVAVGRLHSQKGFDVLLRAFAVARAQIDCRLVILGDGPERARLAAQAEQSGLGYDIDMPGFCANPFALMARAGAFVLSSRWEGFPNALVEAMACGAPVIATDCPSGPREILQGGHIAPLVPVDDVDALARTLIATLAARPDTSASRSRAQGFSVASAARQYLAALELA
jgi:glycosyltransferase involved in cell wall biosynthesis